MTKLKLSQAITIIDAALVKGHEQKFAPLAVAVLDAGGHLIAVKREDGASYFRFNIAYGKAWGALGMGFGTRELAERAANSPAFFNSLTSLSQGRMVPSPGGVLILGPDKEILGAVGISGDFGDNDEICAIAGVESAGLLAAPASLAAL